MKNMVKRPGIVDDKYSDVKSKFKSVKEEHKDVL